MTEENSRGYFMGRSAHEREMAEAAVNPKIADIHSELAERYDWLADNAALTRLRLAVVGER